MAWVPVEQALFTHRKTYAVSDALDIPEVYVVGHLTALWTWAMDSAKDGVIRASRRVIAKAAQWPGDAEQFVGALLDAGFLDEGEDGALILHDWQDYGGKLVEKRTSDAARKRESRTSAGHPQDIQRTAHVEQRTEQNRTEEEKRTNPPTPQETRQPVGSGSSGALSKAAEDKRTVDEAIAAHPHWKDALDEEVRTNPAPVRNVTGFKAAVVRSWLADPESAPAPPARKRIGYAFLRYPDDNIKQAVIYEGMTADVVRRYAEKQGAKIETMQIGDYSETAPLAQ